MKPTNFLALLLGVFTLTACSQEIPESDIPSVVLNTLDLKFANATDVEWDKNAAIYEVDFEVNNIEHEALIEETGDLVKYKKDMVYAELPEAVKSSMTADPSTVDDVQLLVIGNETYYQLEFEGTLTDSGKVYNDLGEEMKDVNYYD